MAVKELKLLKEFIDSERKKHNWSEREFAKAANLNPTTVNEFLGQPDKDIRLSTIADMLATLGVPLFYALMDQEQRNLWDKKTAEADPVRNLETRVSALEGDSRQITLPISPVRARFYARLRSLSDKALEDWEYQLAPSLRNAGQADEKKKTGGG